MLVSVLVLGLVVGLIAMSPTHLISLTVVGGLVFALGLKVPTILYLPVYSLMLLAINMDLAGLAMWGSVAFTAIVAGAKLVSSRQHLIGSEFRSILVWWALFLAARALSAVFSPYPDIAAENLLHYGIVLVLFVATYIALSPGLVPKVVLHSIGATAGLAVIVLAAYYSYYGGLRWGLFDRAMKFALWNQGINLNVIAFLLSLVALPAAALFLQVKSVLMKAVTGGGTALAVIAVAFSNSRSADLFLLCEGVLFGTWLLLRNSPKRAWSATMALLLAALVGSALLASGVLSGSGDGRAILMEIGWEKFERHPGLGWGPGTFSQGVEQFALLDELRRQTGLDENLAGQAHNMILNNLAEVGLVGTAPVVGFFVLIMVKAYRRREKLSLLSAALLISVLCMPIRDFFEISGLFGDADGMAELFSWVWVAIAVRSLEGREEEAA